MCKRSDRFGQVCIGLGSFTDSHLSYRPRLSESRSRPMSEKKQVKSGSSQVWGWVRLGCYAAVKLLFWILEEGG